MPRTTRPSVYGPEYEEMLKVASEHGGFTLTLPSHQKAMAFRIKVYSYFKALAHENKRKDLIRHANSFVCKVTGPTFTMSLRTDEWDNTALRDALSLQRASAGAAVDTTHTLLAKLQELRKKDS